MTKTVMIPNGTYAKISFIVTIGTTELITNVSDMERDVQNAITEQLSNTVMQGANQGFVSEVAVTRYPGGD